MVAITAAKRRRRTRRQLILDGLTVLFAVVAPVAIILSFRGQLAATGNVSHWPWEAYGFFGWWEVPLALWVAAACSASRRGLRGGVTLLLLLLAVVTTLSLLYNPA